MSDDKEQEQRMERLSQRIATALASVMDAPGEHAAIIVMTEDGLTGAFLQPRPGSNVEEPDFMRLAKELYRRCMEDRPFREEMIEHYKLYEMLDGLEASQQKH